MWRRKSQLVAGLVPLLAWLTVSSWADELAEKGRAIFNQHRQAVITVQLVLKTKFSAPGTPSRTNEVRQTVSGTVVNPDGLAVVSLSAIDPARIMQNTGDERGFKMETELGEVQMLVGEETELPAQVVWKDADLDLAFLRPKVKPVAALPALDLVNSGQAEVLDEIIGLNRLGSAAGRAYSAAVERVSAIVRTPRLAYIPDANMTTTTLGAPAFTLDGKVLGIFVLRSTRVKAVSGRLGSPAENLTGIIIPAADVLKAAQQAPPAAAGK